MRFSSLVSVLSTSTVVTAATSIICYEDNCFRRMQNNPASVSAFCPTYTTASNTAPTALPSWISSVCGGLPARVTSACICQYPQTITTSSIASTSVPSSTASSFLVPANSSTVSTSSSSSFVTSTSSSFITSSTLASNSSATSTTSSSSITSSASLTSDSSSVVSSSSTATITTAPVITTRPVCNKDNCNNQIFNTINTARASDFCKTYTTSINTNTAAIPTYLANCKQDVARVSLACTCLLWPTTSSVSSSVISTLITSASSVSSSVSSSATPSPTEAACAADANPAGRVDVLPSANPTLDRTSFVNLRPSKFATLYYSEAAPGTQVLALEYDMDFPQVTLEDSSLLTSIKCSANSIQLSVTDAMAYRTISAWPQSDLVLITNSAGCNPTNQRGVYMVTSSTLDATTQTITLQVTTKTWKDVAYTMEIRYGQAMASVGATAPFTSSCTEAYHSATATSASSTSSATPSSGDVTYDSLTAEQKAVVAFLVAKLKFNADGNIIGSMPGGAKTDVPVTTPTSYDPDNAALQKELEDELQKDGMSSPAKLFAQAANNLAGYCDATGNYVPPTKRSESGLETPGFSRVRRGLVRRGDDDDPTFWKYLWEIGCNEIFQALLGIFSEGASAIDELICALKELYDTVEEAYKQRDAIKCVFNGCYLDLPPTTIYDFTYSWKVDFNALKDTKVVWDGAGNSVTCIDCSVHVTEVKFIGNLKIILKTSEIVDAYMTTSMSAKTNMLMSFNAVGKFAYNWVYAMSTGDFSPVYVPGVFTITPSMIYSIGVDFSTDAAVDFIAGGNVNLNQATAQLNFKKKTADSFAGWNPDVSLIYPTISKNAKVKFIPLARSALKITVKVLGSEYTPPAVFTQETLLGFEGEVSAVANGCPADTLKLTSYYNSKNSLLWTSTPQLLGPEKRQVGATSCFSVPSNKPSAEELASLKSVGAEYCTSVIKYVAPTVAGYFVSTTSTLKTVPTTVLTTQTTRATSWVYPTTTVVQTYSYSTVGPYVYSYTAGSQSLSASYMKRGLPAPTGPITMQKMVKQAAATATGSPFLQKRVNPPALVSGWDTKKISYACSQVATGTVTRTVYTSTATSYTGTVTATVYSTIDVQGLAVTSTYMNTVLSITARTVTNTNLPTTTRTVASSCPLQTQASCFTITGHGAPHIEGKKLGVKSGYSSPMFGQWGYDYEPTTFYLTCAGHLVALPDMQVLSNPSGYEWVEFNWWWYASTNAQTCHQDPVAKSLVCGVGWGGYGPWTSYDGDADSRYWSPMDPNTASGVQGYFDMSLTYEEVACPCAS